jgi:hypothetical protein
MGLEEHRFVFFVVVGVLALVVASPGLSRLLVFPRTEFFTEFWVLGPDGVAEDYPFNVTCNRSYSVFLGVGNRLGYCGYYVVMVKFRNQSLSGPDGFSRTASGLPSLFNWTVFVEDEGVWEERLTFSFDYTVNDVGSKVLFSSLVLNGVVLDLSDYVVVWDEEKGGFYGNLFFELWLYNSSVGGFEYHERFLGLWLNMTVS